MAANSSAAPAVVYCDIWRNLTVICLTANRPVKCSSLPDARAKAALAGRPIVVKFGKCPFPVRK